MKKGMKIAFEDQLVQKVMPKLRGIETRGKSRDDCLNPIRAQLDGDNYSIVGDFDAACEFGYGQFIWSSANYLEENIEIEAELLDELIDNSAKESAVASDQNGKKKTEGKSDDTPEKVTKVEPALGHKSNIPKELEEFTKKKDMKLYQLSQSDIKVIMKCNAKEAKILKDLVNATKDQ
jgi:hypothetical protein